MKGMYLGIKGMDKFVMKGMYLGEKGMDKLDNPTIRQVTGIPTSR